MTSMYTLSVSGIRVDLERPLPAMFCVTDIAHALGHLNRFSGNLPIPYSVAQHSVIVSRMVPAEMALAALLHDAHESVTNDVPAPVKNVLPGPHNSLALLEAAAGDPRLSADQATALRELLKQSDIAACIKDQFRGLAGLEDRLQRTIHLAFDLPEELPVTWQREIRRADLLALAWEKRDLMWVNDGPWALLDGMQPPSEPLVAINARRASMLFRERFHEITKPGSAQHLAA